MKKRNKGFLFAYLLLLLLLSSAFPAAAEAEADVDYEHVPEEFKAFLEAFPEDLCALLPDGLFAEDAVSVGDAALSLGNFSGLLRALLSLLGARLPEAAALLATVAGLLILSAVFRALQNAVGSGGIGRAFSFCSTVAVLAALLGEGYVCVRTVTEYFTTLNGVCAASLPLSATLYAMGGNTATAAASSAALTVYMTVMEELIGKPEDNGMQILLAHNPKYGKTYFEWGADLILSGHYHGGVVRLSEHYGLSSPQYLFLPPFCCGDFHKGDQHMIVSAGLGEHTIPLRIHNPRELLLIDIKPSEKMK